MRKKRSLLKVENDSRPIATSVYNQKASGENSTKGDFEKEKPAK